ncbi:MAG: pyruvate dehydrogenase (acetyl-transferring) E1 component subunit alpha [Acidimicrobiia bacterium]|nr:pyruvate dehydrogenase (acetyl-transferring) E1 component subunit alpha [Acidimicrobiia bacterium]
MWQTRTSLESDYPTFQLLSQSGDLAGDAVAGDVDFSESLTSEMYRLMVLSREFDRRMLALQRQGRIGTYPMLEGQEAVQIGSALALAENDFVFPSYREHGVQLARGVPIDVVMSYWRGLPNQDWDVLKYRMGITAVPIASQLPHAVGYSYVTKLRREDSVAVTYFGDGATSEVDFHSGMNFAGVWRTPTVFICANNLYAISVHYDKQTASETIAQKAVAYGFPGVRVDGMDVLAMYQVTKLATDRARRGEGPTLIEAMTYRYGAHATADDARRYRSAEEEDSWRQRDPIERFRRFLEKRGQWDEQAGAKVAMEVADQVEAAITEIEARPLPPRADAIRHAYHRILPSLIEQLHRAEDANSEPRSEFAPDEIWERELEPEPTGPTATMTMAEAINAALRQAMETENEAIILGEDVGISGGVFRITEGLQETFGEDRVIDTPLNESGIVGTAIGMAMAGARPIAEIQFDGFVYPAFDQIVSHLGRFRFRTRGNVTVPVVVRFPSGAGIGAHEHHCDSPEAYFVHAPGLVVVCPSTPYDAKGLLASALMSPDPVIFLEPKVLYRAGREEVPTEHFQLPLGRARVRQEGNDLTLVTYGGMVPQALTAAAGRSIEVIDLRTLFPWDRETVIASVEKTGRLLLVQEPQGAAGVAAEVAAVVAEHCLFSLQAPIVRLTGFDAPWPQFAIERHALIDHRRIGAAIDQALK